VAAVEWRDEGAAHRDQHVAGDVVGVLLAVHDGLIVALHRLAALQHGAQRLGAGQHGPRMACEHVEEALLLRHQGVKPAHHGKPPGKYRPGRIGSGLCTQLSLLPAVPESGSLRAVGTLGTTQNCAITRRFRPPETARSVSKSGSLFLSACASLRPVSWQMEMRLGYF